MINLKAAMKTVELLTELEKLGVQLRLEHGEIACRAPKGVLTSELRQLMAQRKSELIVLLQEAATDDVFDHDAVALPTPDAQLQIVSEPEQRHEPFALTDIQQAYWLGRNSAFELGNVGNHLYVELDCQTLDLSRLTVAWQQIIDRREMLRAVVTSDGQQQILAQVSPYTIEVRDLCDQDSDTVSQILTESRDRMSHQVFQPEQWPWFELKAYRLTSTLTQLHISIELWDLDVTSATIVFREWWQLYSNPNLCLEPLTLSFRDYIRAISTFQQSATYQRSLTYWQQRVATLPPPPELSLAVTPSTLTHPRFKCHRATLPADIWSQLQQQALHKGLSPSGILLAAYAEVLATWSKSQLFTINITLFSRLPLHPKISEVAGDFTSLILLAVDNSAQETFQERAHRIQKQLWEALDHAHVSGVQVLRDWARHQSVGQEALMPVVFTSALNTRNEGIFEWLNQFGEINYSISQTPQVWLDYQAHEQQGALTNIWAVVEGLFPEGLIEAMLAAYDSLLNCLAKNPDSWQRISFPLLPEEQLTQRATINATQMSVSEHLLHTPFIQQVSQRPEQLAIVTPYYSLSYGELYQRMQQVRRRLQQLKNVPNTLVGVVMDKGWQQVVAVLGILQAGAAYLPIDPDWPPERIAQVLIQAKVELVLTQAWLQEGLAGDLNIQKLVVDQAELGEPESDGPDRLEDTLSLTPVQTPDDLAYVIFTSGSTGVPKGVMITHRGAVNTLLDLNERFEIQSTDRVFALSSLSFDLSVYDIFGTLAAGGTIIMPEKQQIKDPEQWVALMHQHQATVWNSVPAFAQMLADYCQSLLPPEQKPIALRLMMLSGDWIPLSLPEQIHALWSDIQLMSLGGATEASIWSILYPITTVDPEWSSIPYGKPLRNQSFQILNDQLQPCPIWVPGQLYIGGVGLAQGYWQAPEKTQSSFIEHPVTGERLYRTGDLGRYLPDGNIEFLGREDLQVKVGGYRIELGEIESRLAQHALLQAAIVTAAGKTRGYQRLVAFIVPKEDTISTDDLIDELSSSLRESLPGYMVPSIYIPLEKIPLTANGKVDRQALQVPNTMIFESDVTDIPPQSEIEQQLAAIVKKVLAIEDTVGVQRNFFDLGATSVHVVQLHSQLKAELDIDIPILEIFGNPNIRFLAKHLNQRAVAPKSENVLSARINERTEKQKGLRDRRQQLMKTRKKQ